jgi:hypothetical protein
MFFGYNKLGGGRKTLRVETFVDAPAPQSTPPPLKYTFAVIATFINKSHRMREWIQHYLWQGVEHFYLVDEGSNDDYWTVLETYTRRGLVTVVPIPVEDAKEKKWNAVFQRYRSDSKWFAVIDLDTYLYSMSPKENLATLLERAYASNVAGLYVHGNVFGSRKDVECVRKTMISRQIHPGEHPIGIVRSRYTASLHTNTHEHPHGDIRFPADIRVNVYDEDAPHDDVDDNVLRDMVQAKFKSSCW